MAPACIRAPLGGFRGSPISEATSLNSDPWNLRAEEQALETCIGERPVRRVWTERELVRTFGGHMSAGTPDGMFELWDNTTTCVQVVRAPWRSMHSTEALGETLQYTVLTKVIKSQAWLRMSSSTPDVFVIFVWLPFSAGHEAEAPARDLMARVRELDPRFELQLKVAEVPADLFPPLFATSCSLRKASQFSEADIRSEDDFSTDDSSEEWECALSLWDDTGWDTG